MRTLAILTSLLLAAPSGAQAVIDTFPYPNGTLIPGWTQQRGSWQVQNGRLSVTSGSSVWAYITRDGITATNCVLDGTFYYNPTTGVQFGGLTTRHPGGNVDTNLLMTKIQNNGGAADLDRVFCYERGAAGNSYADIVGGTQAAHFRMITLDSEFWCEVDANLDGHFELVLAPRPITLVTGPGLVGMSAFQTTEMDDFEYFDAVLTPQPGATPRIGTSYNLRLATTMPNTVYLGALSRGNAGVLLGDGRAVPLTLDNFALNTFGMFALGMIGVTDANGRAAIQIPLPPLPALIGMQLFTSFVTMDGNRHLGIGDISNEHGFAIVQ